MQCSVYMVSLLFSLFNNTELGTIEFQHCCQCVVTTVCSVVNNTLTTVLNSIVSASANPTLACYFSAILWPTTTVTDQTPQNYFSNFQTATGPSTTLRVLWRSLLVLFAVWKICYSFGLSFCFTLTSQPPERRARRQTDITGTITAATAVAKATPTDTAATAAIIVEGTAVIKAAAAGTETRIQTRIQSRTTRTARITRTTHIRTTHITRTTPTRTTPTRTITEAMAGRTAITTAGTNRMDIIEMQKRSYDYSSFVIVRQLLSYFHGTCILKKIKVVNN